MALLLRERQLSINHFQERATQPSRMHKFTIGLLAVLLLVCGCPKVGPNFTKPQANVNPNWLEAGAYQQVSTRPDDYRDWWRSFHDPVLDDLIQSAYRQNLTLQIAGVRVLETQAQVGVAVGKLYPQTQQFNGTVQKIRFSQNNLSSGTGTPSNFWLSTMGLTASWEIDFWGKIRRGIESADASLAASISDYDNTLVTLTGDVASAYISAQDPGKAPGHRPPERPRPEKEPADRHLPLEGRHHLASGRGAGHRRCWTAPRPPSRPWRARCSRPRTPCPCSWACPPAT